MINTKLNLLPIELLNYIWNFQDTIKDRLSLGLLIIGLANNLEYNKCVIELNDIFNKFNKLYSTAQAGRGCWPMNEMLPTKFLYTYQNKEHRYFLKKIKENK